MQATKKPENEDCTQELDCMGIGGIEGMHSVLWVQKQEVIFLVLFSLHFLKSAPHRLPDVQEGQVGTSHGS